MQPGDPQHGLPPRPDLAQLAALHLALARADDEHQLLAIAADLLAAPARIDLLLLHRDASGAPHHVELATSWPAADPPMALNDPLTRRWLHAPDTPLHAPADAARRVTAPISLLPLRPPDGPALACLRMHWIAGEPARLPPELLHLVATSLAVTLVGIRDRRARAHALAAAHRLHAALAELHAATDLAGALAVVASHAAHDGATAAWLLRSDVAGPQIAARWGRASAIAEAPALATLATATTPQFLSPLAATDLAPGFHAASVLPLRRHGRCDGHMILAWPTAHDFSPDERHHFPVLARQAAIVIANHRLLASARAALHAQQHQSATLTTILDNLPVGVVVHTADHAEPLLVNRCAEQLRRDLLTTPLLYPGSDTPMPPSQWPIARALHDDQIVVGEAEFRRADGTRRALESVAAPVHDPHGALTHVIAVTTEVTAWRDAEAEQQAMHEALIHAQAAALSERSTPLLPIADDILVLPIVGAIDEHRGQQITETLVELGGSQRVRVAILDVTGAGTLDERGAHLLVGAARALRLRGVRPILTGLGPDAAASLAAAGVDLAGVIVLGSLQAGIARARALTRR